MQSVRKVDLCLAQLPFTGGSGELTAERSGAAAELRGEGCVEPLELREGEAMLKSVRHDARAWSGMH